MSDPILGSYDVSGSVQALALQRRTHPQRIQSSPLPLSYLISTKVEIKRLLRDLFDFFMPLFQKGLGAENFKSEKSRRHEKIRKQYQVRQVSKPMTHKLVPRFGPQHPSGQHKEGNTIPHVIPHDHEILKQLFR